VDISFPDSVRCAIIGGNGSGKSTLLQIISGFLSSSEGKISWQKDRKETSFENLFRHVALCTPMMSLYDDLTLEEQVTLWCKFRKFDQGLSISDFTKKIELHQHRNKKLRHFSSGMRQRVKLGLALFSISEIILLDEPTSHLDGNAIGWFQEILPQNLVGKSLFVASNSNQTETALCTTTIDIQQYKKSFQTS
jgi:ABC-type multidrug transport system ATPase subunit